MSQSQFSVETPGQFSVAINTVASGMNPRDLKRGIDLAVDAVVQELKD